jgi:hypothetical protein
VLNGAAFRSIGRVRSCSSPACRHPARRDARTCALCNAAAFRRWYKRHRKGVLADRRAAADARSEEQRARDTARAKLATAIRRGTIVRESCRLCNEPDVTAYIADPAEWRKVIWLCREHRAEEIARLTAPSQEALLAAKTACREAALASIAALAKPERARLHAIAACGPAGLLLTPEAPLYTIRLIRAYEALAAPST